MSERDPLTEDELQEVERHLQRYPGADRGQLEDAIRRRRGRDSPVAERERAQVRAELSGEGFEALLQRLRDAHPDPPAESSPPATSPATETARAAWAGLQDAPVPVPYVKGKDSLILTRQVAQIEDTAEGFYLSRFGTAAHRHPESNQLLLGFEHPEMKGPTLPANVWTLYVDEAEKRGSGLPAALRIFLASILRVPLYARRVESPTDPPVSLGAGDDPLTLRTFLTWIYEGRTRPGEFWPRLMAARDVLHSTAAEVAYEWRGRLWRRQVVNLDWPGNYDRNLLDERWPVSVWLPPGTGNGAPIVEARLRYWWTRDAACARALINLAYRWHVEGKRIAPMRDRRSRSVWLYRRDPKLYDRITDRDRDLLCFPPGTGEKRRDKRISDGDAALQRLVNAGDAVSIDGRLLPPVLALPPPPESD